MCTQQHNNTITKHHAHTDTTYMHPFNGYGTAYKMCHLDRSCQEMRHLSSELYQKVHTHTHTHTEHINGQYEYKQWDYQQPYGHSSNQQSTLSGVRFYMPLTRTDLKIKPSLPRLDVSSLLLLLLRSRSPDLLRHRSNSLWSKFSTFEMFGHVQVMWSWSHGAWHIAYARAYACRLHPHNVNSTVKCMLVM